MEGYTSNTLKTIKQIKENFDNLSDLNNKKFTKNISHLNLTKRPKFIKMKYKQIDKAEVSHILDQIGNDDLMFNKDKLLTNIKIESFEKDRKKNSIFSAGNDRLFLSKKTNNTTNRHHKYNKTPKNYLKVNNEIKNLLNYISSNDNTLELNCNKISFENGKAKFNNSKKQNSVPKNCKKLLSPPKNKNALIRNVDQFINHS
jgi:hypothetical protein